MTVRQQTLMGLLRNIAQMNTDLAAELAKVPEEPEYWREALKDWTPETVIQIQAYLVGAAQAFQGIRERLLYLNHTLETIAWTRK